MNNFADCIRPVSTRVEPRRIALAWVLAAAFAWLPHPPVRAAEPPGCPPLLDHTFNRLQNGEAQSLCQYRGKVLLVVNTASLCGYTYQYEGLEKLHRRYKDRGLVVLGFPSNEFGSQEPGSNKQVAEFCRTTYGIEFPMYEKTTVSKLAANPFYAQLIARSGTAPRWNFHKYLIDRNGARIQSFGSDVEPEVRELTVEVERLLAEKPAS
jgi:glutathione peroxidase